MAFNKNQIKKILYKEKPIASRHSYDLTMNGGIYTYVTETSVGKFLFKIPEADKPVNLNLDEPAQLLIRWLEVTE